MPYKLQHMKSYFYPLHNCTLDPPSTVMLDIKQNLLVVTSDINNFMSINNKLRINWR